MSLSEHFDEEMLDSYEQMSELDRVAIMAHIKWLADAHKYQIAPPLEIDWDIWVLLAGRGAGKTRAAAETLWWWAWTQPNTRWLILAPTSGDLKKTCFDGESGLIAKIPQELIAHYNKQDFLITLKNGSLMQGISADAFERLRGPQFHGAWCDELAAFQYLGEGQAWDMMRFGVRLGEHPRIIVTTTPKPKDLIVELVSREGQDVIVDRASTYANRANLAGSFIKSLEKYKGTKLFEQEVLGEIVDLEDGKVVSRKDFRLWPADKPFPKFEFILQSYDCAFTDKEHNDPTAAGTWGVFKPEDGPMSVMLLDCWQDHLTFPALKPKVIDEFTVSYGEGMLQKKPNMILVEEKAAGISLIQELQRAHLPVRGYNPGRADKMQRLQIAATALAARRVWLPESSVRKGYVRDWVEPMLSQLCSFPDSAHDDFVDMFSQAMRYLMDAGFIEINPPPRDDDDYLVDPKGKKGNPYDA